MPRRAARGRRKRVTITRTEPMFDRLIAFSVRNRLLVVAVAALIAAYGGYVLTLIPVDVFPDLNRPTVTIFTEAGGLAPDEVEMLVTVPLETAVNGAAGVERVRSMSGIGLSLVFVEFGWETDTYRARQIVGEKVAEVTPRLPQEIRPFLGPVSSIMGQIMAIGLTSENPSVSPMELRTLADWDIRRRLMSIPGVSQITVMGGDVRQYQVLVDPALLVAAGVTLHEVQSAIDESNVNSSGGFLPDAHNERLIRNLARVESAEDLAITVVKVLPDGSSILLGQIAEVREGASLNKRGDAGIDGRPGVILTVQKQPGADTIALTRKIEAELEIIGRSLPDGVKVHADIFRQSNFIARAVRNVEEALRDGSLMVAVVLFIFLLNFRTTAITLTAIPLSLLTTFIVFHAAGLGINTMTLGGLAVAIGELVDDAIVDVETAAGPRCGRGGLAGNPQFHCLCHRAGRARLSPPLRPAGYRGAHLHALGGGLHRVHSRIARRVSHRDTRLVRPASAADETHGASAGRVAGAEDQGLGSAVARPRVRRTAPRLPRGRGPFRRGAGHPAISRA
jgi:Cu/Ag efflux pump CusA